MNTKFNRWTNPVLDEKAADMYAEEYGENGKSYIRMLEDSPYEIAVVSRLIAYLGVLKGEKR